MDCLEYRRKLLEDPFRSEPAFIAHEDACDSCADHARGVRGDDIRLRHALRIDTPPELAERIRLTARLEQRNRSERKRAWWFSAAAGVLVAIAAFTSSVLLSPLDRNGVALAQSVLNHMEAEAHHLQDAGPVRKGKVRYLFQQFGARYEGELGDIDFAAICLMRRKTGVHLVFSGERGPVTVFFMPGESPQATVQVSSARFDGRILPVHWGSIAVIGAPGEQLDGMAERMRDAVHWPSANGPDLPQVRS